MIIPVLPFGTEIFVAAIAVVYTCLAVGVQRFANNPKKTREMQYKMKMLSNELNAMIKRNAAQEEIAAKQKELMPLMSASMKSQFKPMFMILPIFFVLYYWIMPHLFAASISASVQSLFFIIVFVLGMASSFIVLAYDKKKTKEENEARQRSESSGALQNPT
jgi:uncharacterized membrane protein (DUF106 family)